MKRGHYVYRLFDADGIPLYVGASVDPDVRFGQHRLDSKWWHLVDATRTVISNHKSEAEKISEEESEIYRLTPLFNVSGIDRAYSPPPRERPYNPAGWTPTRRIELPRALYEEAKAVTAAWGDTVPTLIRRSLVQYVKENQR